MFLITQEKVVERASDTSHTRASKWCSMDVWLGAVVTAALCFMILVGENAMFTMAISNCEPPGTTNDRRFVVLADPQLIGKNFFTLHSN